MGVGIPRKNLSAKAGAFFEDVEEMELPQPETTEETWTADGPILSHAKPDAAIVKLANGDNMLVSKEIAIRDHGWVEQLPVSRLKQFDDHIAESLANQTPEQRAELEALAAKVNSETPFTMESIRAGADLLESYAVEPFRKEETKQDQAAERVAKKRTARRTAKKQAEVVPEVDIAPESPENAYQFNPAPDEVKYSPEYWARLDAASLAEKAQADQRRTSEPWTEGQIGPNNGTMTLTYLGWTESFLPNVIDMTPGGPLPPELQAERDALPIPEKPEYDGLHHFITPDWVVRACLSAIPRSPAPARILDAGAGTGTWGAGARALFPKSIIYGSEIDGKHAKTLPYDEWFTGDFLRFAADGDQYQQPGSFDLVMSNPPFNQATDFVRMACYLANPDGGRVVMLLRLAILESLSRARDFWGKLPA
jgi:hypothetical protein